MTQAQIIRGTTPTITFAFRDISTTDIVAAILAVKQAGNTVIEKNMSSATKPSTSTMSWTLTQADTLSLSSTINRALIVCDWVTSSGLRGRSIEQFVSVGEPAKNAEISVGGN